MGRNIDDFLAHAKSIDWYHAGRTHQLSDIVHQGIRQPELSEPGQNDGGTYGPGFNMASHPDDVAYYLNQSDEESKSGGSVLRSKFTGRNPLVYADRIHGVVTPNHQDIIMKALAGREEDIKNRVVAGKIPDVHGGYLLEKLNKLRRGVENNDSRDLGHAAPFAGFDSFITDEHQLHNWGKPESLQAVLNKPHAIRPVGIHTSKQFSEMFSKK
jgi:hypothetical protein